MSAGATIGKSWRPLLPQSGAVPHHSTNPGKSGHIRPGPGERFHRSECSALESHPSVCFVLPFVPLSLGLLLPARAMDFCGFLRLIAAGGRGAASFRSSRLFHIFSDSLAPFFSTAQCPESRIPGPGDPDPGLSIRPFVASCLCWIS